MKIIDTNIEDVKIIEPTIHYDERGYFFETYRQDLIEKAIGYKLNFCQSNESKSLKGTIRGLHYQLPPYAQTKLARVVSGRVLDIALDIRQGSKTFGEYVAVEINSDNKRELLIPRGFAHAFVVLSDEATFFYKVDNYYNKDSERSIVYNDKTLAINWEIDASLIKISEKDSKASTFVDADIFKMDEKLYSE